MTGAGYGFDGWSVNNGVIDSSGSCTGPGVTCTAVTEDNGFLQEEVIVDGRRFIRMLVTDPGASGNAADLGFSVETFTPFMNLSDPLCQGVAAEDCMGISSKQVVREFDSGLESIAILQRNFAKSNEPLLEDKFNIDIVQNLIQVDASTGLPFEDSFAYRSWTFFECDIEGNCNNSEVIGSRLDISSTIGLDAFEPADVQRFEFRERNGWMGRMDGGFFQSDPVVSSGSMTLGGSTIDGARTGTETTLEYNAGGQFSEVANDISTVYLASDMIDGFAYQGVTVNGVSVSEFLLDTEGTTGSSLAPFTWDENNFGPMPTF